MSMNVRTLCLAILHDGDASGYEIRKLSTEGEYAYFVEASFGAIYPALAKLEDGGLVTSRVESQDGRPAKRIYSLTELGRKTFLDSLFDELDDDVFRSEFLLFARFAPLLPASLVETRIFERLKQMDEKIAQIENIEIDQSNGHAKADDWIKNYGLSCLKVAREQLHTHMHELIALARPADDASKAAE